jgi:hypothetical protein
MMNPDLSSILVDADPYQHVAVKNALQNYASLERDFPSADEFGAHIRSHGDLTHGDEGYSHLLERSAAYRDLHAKVYCAVFVRDFLSLFRKDIEGLVRSGALMVDPLAWEIRPEPYEGRSMLTRERAPAKETFLFPRLDLGIGRLGYGKVNGGKGVHVDNATRLISILVYIGDNPSMQGGEHRLYALRGHTPVLRKTYRPERNLLIASLQSNNALHDVNPVTAIDGVRKAFYMAVSCSTAIWKPPADRGLARLTRNRYQPSTLERLVQRMRKLRER